MQRFSHNCNAFIYNLELQKHKNPQAKPIDMCLFEFQQDIISNPRVMEDRSTLCIKIDARAFPYNVNSQRNEKLLISP